MKHFGIYFLAAFLALSTLSCSRKSGCPAESAQTKVDKDGQYKANKTTSGLLPPKGYNKKKKGAFKTKRVKHRN
jgi:hypothetical protein